MQNGNIFSRDLHRLRVGEDGYGSSHVGSDRRRGQVEGGGKIQLQLRPWPGTAQPEGHTGSLCPSSAALLSLQRSLSVPIKESQCPLSSARNNGLVLPPLPL